MNRLLFVFALLLSTLKGFSQDYQIDADFLKNIDGKYFAFSYFDENEQLPDGMMFQLKYLPKQRTFEVRNLSAFSKWDKGVSYRGSKLTFKDMDTTQLAFSGSLKARHSDGDSTEVECELKIKLYNTEKFETWLYLPNHSTVWGNCKTGTLAFAKEVYDKNVVHRTPTRKFQSYSFTNQNSVSMYLDGKRFVSSSGTEIQMGFGSDYNYGGIKVNGRLTYTDITIDIINNYSAILKATSVDGNGVVKILVDSKDNALVNAGTAFRLK